MPLGPFFPRREPERSGSPFTVPRGLAHAALVVLTLCGASGPVDPTEIPREVDSAVEAREAPPPERTRAVEKVEAVAREPEPVREQLASEPTAPPPVPSPPATPTASPPRATGSPSPPPAATWVPDPFPSGSPAPAGTPVSGAEPAVPPAEPDIPENSNAVREHHTVDETTREAARQSAGPYENARLFDLYVHGKLSAPQVAAMKDACRRSPKGNVFCFTLRRSRSLEKHIAARARVHRPTPAAPPSPIAIEYRFGKIVNWRELRRGKTQAILKGGIASLSLDQLQEIARRARTERLCPNNIAVATAATLEDYLPEATLYPVIAELYEKGASCAVREPVDREHFRTRAGLMFYLAGQYDLSAKLLAKVRPMDAYSGRALYWLYRARRAGGDTGGARAAMKRLIVQHPFSFHSLVAQLGENQDPGERFLGEGSALRKRSRRSMATNRMIEQAETLRRYGFDDSAALIADWTLEGVFRPEPEVRLYLASLGDSHTRIVSLPAVLLRHPKLMNRESMELLYPTGFFPVCEKHATPLGVDPYLLLSLARKESAFDPKAVSIANAQGLLQLNPDTARKLMNGADANLLDPDTNVGLGARYIASLIAMMNGHLHLAIASYNAGDAPVQNWLRRLPKDDTMLFIDLIPYRETRDYVGYVLANYYWYRRLYKPGVPEVFKKLVAASGAAGSF